MTHRLAFPILALLLSATSTALAQGRGPDTGTLVIGLPGEPRAPVPTLWAGNNINREISDLMFLRLADLGPQVNTSDEKRFVPRLARKWTRQDSLTIVFELDPRAKWQDGRPVVGKDIVFAMERARNPKYGGGTAAQLRHIDQVSSDTPNRVTFRFKQPYAEQLYDAVYHVPPLPSHLLGNVNPDSLASSSYAAAPVGNGPYRFVRRVPGQLVELSAVSDFFLGRPRIERVVVRVIGAPEARANMLLSGEIDAIDNVYTLPDPAQVNALADYRYYPAPGNNLLYLIFNQRSPADTSQPHPILADREVRRALVQAIDRERLAQSVYGPFTHAPSAPISSLIARSAESPPAIPYDVAGAQRLLADRGWKDSNGDGLLDRNGTPLALTLMVPSTSAPRKLIAAQIQEAYRRIGITLNLEMVDIPVYVERRNRGGFDLEFYGVAQDPTPTGLVSSWTCGGLPTFNTGHYCNPMVDSLIARGTLSQKPAPAIWKETFRRMSEDYPAMVIAAVVSMTAVNKRFEKVTIRPESMWSDVWQWSVKPGAQLERDRQ